MQTAEAELLVTTTRKCDLVSFYIYMLSLAINTGSRAEKDLRKKLWVKCYFLIWPSEL